LLAGALMLVATLHVSLALAQGGSAGGSIGKQGKSASGANEEPAPAPPPSRSKLRRSSSEADSSCRGMSGKWSWSTGGETVIRSSGTLSKGELTGKWTCKSGDVLILWSHGYTDRLVLSANEGRMAGKNQLGLPISGRRKGAE
jgi:hypothetical protein